MPPPPPGFPLAASLFVTLAASLDNSSDLIAFCFLAPLAAASALALAFRFSCR